MQNVIEPNKINPSRKIYFLLGLLFITNLVFSTFFELSFDEAYYWFYSQFLSPGYYDHPPMVGVLIKLGEFFFPGKELGVRLFSNVLMTLSVFVMWQLTEKKNFLVFTTLVLSMPLLGFSGLLALPDTPLLFFSVCFFASVKSYLSNETFKHSVFVALSIIGMFYSKYHGLLIVLLTVLAHTKLLRRKSFWLIVFAVIVGYLPHMWWQYQHDFISFKFHLTGRTEKHFDFLNILNYVFSQVALMGFFSFFLLFFVWNKKRRERKALDPFEKILLFNSIGFFLFLFFMSFRNQIEANWTVTCSAAMIIYLSDKLSEIQKRRLYVFNILPIILGITLKFILISPGSFFDLSRDNRINEIVGWKEFKIPAVQKLCSSRRIIADNYQIASKFGFYLGYVIPALHFGSRDSHYMLVDLSDKPKVDEEICYLTSKNLEGSVRIDSGYKDPVYVLEGIKLSDLLDHYKVTYEKIFGNRN